MITKAIADNAAESMVEMMQADGREGFVIIAFSGIETEPNSEGNVTFYGKIGSPILAQILMDVYAMHKEQQP